MVPVSLHVIGVGFTIFIKLYYDMSPKVSARECWHRCTTGKARVESTEK